MSKKITEEELPEWFSRGVTAGPDDPIYNSGIRVSLGKPEPLTDDKAGETEDQNASSSPSQVPSEWISQIGQEAREQFGAVPDEDDAEDKE